MNNHKVILKAKRVKKGDKTGRWIERRAHLPVFEVPADGFVLYSDHVNVPILYIRDEDIENLMNSEGEEVELVSWGDDMAILPYS